MGSFFDWLLYVIVEAILSVMDFMTRMKRIFLFIGGIFYLGFAWLFLHAARRHPLPHDIFKSVWVLGGCFVAFGLFLLVECFMPNSKKKRRDSLTS